MLSLVTTCAAAALHVALAGRFFWHALMRPALASALASLVCMTMPVGWLVVVFQEFNARDVRLAYPSLLTLLAFWMGAVPLAVLLRLDHTKPFPYR